MGELLLPNLSYCNRFLHSWWGWTWPWGHTLSVTPCLHDCKAFYTALWKRLQSTWSGKEWKLLKGWNPILYIMVRTTDDKIISSIWGGGELKKEIPPHGLEAPMESPLLWGSFRRLWSRASLSFPKVTRSRWMWFSEIKDFLFCPAVPSMTFGGINKKCFYFQKIPAADGATSLSFYIAVQADFKWCGLKGTWLMLPMWNNPWYCNLKFFTTNFY